MENKTPLGNAYSGGISAATFGGAKPSRNKRILVIAIAAAVFILLIATLVIVFSVYTNSRSNNSQFENTNVDLTDVPPSDFEDAKELTIIGQLNVDGGFAITPTAQPSNPSTGQIYFDQTANTLSYYNGTEFVEILGDLNVGTGLASNDGVLTNSGVISLQGATGDVTLTAGAGITISGTTISATTAGVGGSGIAGRLVKFTGAQTLADSLLTEGGTTVTVGGDLSVTGGLSLTTPLAAASGGTGAASLTANGVLIGNGTGAITSVAAAGAGLCLQSTAGAPTFAACPGGGGVTSLNGLTGALTIANSSGLGSTITIDNATTAAKGIASFNSTNFTVVSGAVNTIQDIATTASPTFANMTLTGDLAVNGNNITSTGGISIESGGASNITLDSAALISMLDTVSLSSLGATDNAAYLCRNSSNQIAACNSTGAGVAFINGGNSFGATGTLGTNDNNDLIIERNNATQLTFGNGGITLASNIDFTLAGASAFISNPQASTGGEAFGAGATTANNGVSIGNAATATGTSSIAIGASAGTGNTQSIAIGAGSGTGTGGRDVAIGHGAVAGIGATTGSISLGYLANAADSNAISLGYTSSAAGSASVALGGLADADGNDSIAIGYQAHTTSQSAIAIGYGSEADFDGIAFGYGATTGGNESTVIGTVAQSTGSNSLTIGHGSIAAAGSAALGYDAEVTGLDAVGIGGLTRVGHDHSIAIGVGATTTLTKQLVIGGSTANITNVVIGNGVTSATPTGFTLYGTSGSGSNIVGASVSVGGGQGTGNANGGGINFLVSPAGAPGSSLNPHSTVASFSGLDGSVNFINAENSTQAFNVEVKSGGNLFTIDTINSRVGINVGGNNVPDLPVAGLHINGALHMTANGSSGWADYITPLGSTINGKVAIDTQSMTGFSQIVALGLDAASSSTSRGILVADNRAGAHQPSIAVLSPDENQVAGMSWDGSSSVFRLKNTANGTLALNLNGTDYLTTTSTSSTVNGLLVVTSLGSADSATYLCRNSSNQLASCNSTGTGVAFINDGNSLSGTATLGTNDANALNFETNGTTRISISSTGDITIGTSDTTGSLLVLDTKTSAGDPSGTNGGMYYNSSTHKMRCYEGGQWWDCNESSRTGLRYFADFLGNGGDSPFEEFGSGTTTYIAGVASHPGIVQQETDTGTTSFEGFGINNLNDTELIFSTSDVWRFDTVLRVPTLSGSGQTFIVLAGFMDALDVNPTDGCYFRYSDTVNSGEWQGECADAGTSTCDTNQAVAANTWYRLSVVVNGSTADFQINGTSVCTVSANIPTTAGNETGVNMGIRKTGGSTERTLQIDYMEAAAQLAR